MRPSLFNEFKESTALARLDAALNQQLLTHYQTTDLLLAKGGLCRSTCVALAWNIQQARVVFKHHPERIRGVIAKTDSANALAVWGDEQRHWIVVTAGLMVLLRDAAEANAARILDVFPTAFESASGRRLLAATPLPGFRTMLGALLYFGAMSFVASHELGHHLAGHGAVYNAPGKSGLLARWDVSHALERQADAIGVGGAVLSMNKLMNRFFTDTALTPAQRKEQQTLTALVFTAGVLTIAARLVPASFDFEQAPSAAHPPNVYRMIKIAAMLMRPLRSLGLLDDPARKAIRIKCLEIVLGPRIALESTGNTIYNQQAAPATLRLNGMRRALNDPSYRAYMHRLDAGFLLFEENLRTSS
jgi:hypothetical protein